MTQQTSRVRRFHRHHRSQHKAYSGEHWHAVMVPAISYVETPIGWTSVLRHNLHVAAVLTAMAEAEP